MYSAVITYTISEDKIRRAFAEMIQEWGFEKRRENTVYALNKHKGMEEMKIVEGIIGWSKTTQKETGKKFKDTDFIEVYIAGKDAKGNSEILAHAFTFDPETGEMQ